MSRRLALALVALLALGSAASAQAPAADPIKDGTAALDKQDFAKAAEIFTAGFKAGNAEAGFYLARMVELGVGMPADPVTAVPIYKAAAEKGSAKALNRVGLMHFRGEAGSLQDFQEARTKICKAGELGEKDGLFNCAEMTMEGKGGPKDAAKAMELYQKAADGGHIGALNVLGLAHRDGVGVAKDFAKARSYFETSASKGNPVGLYELGRMFEEGRTVAKDLAKAHLYYNLAGARSHPAAAEALKRVAAVLSPADLEKAQLDARTWKATN